MGYRLGLDLGVNSLGWCALELDAKGAPRKVLDVGVRLFTDGRDPKKGTSLAVDRRVARQMRRRRDRYLRRRETLMDALVRFGLMPPEPAARKPLELLDPYELRAKALDEKLPLHHFGRALFHLNQRRGFKSSRKTDRGGDDNERGLIETGIQNLKKALEETGARTIGEYLGKRHKNRAPVRARASGKGANAAYEFYPQRALVEHEFDLLWDKQATFHSDLTGEARSAIREIMFWQRPLRPVDPGRCTLDPDDERAPRALPLAQRYRMYQELNNLRIIGRDQKSGALTLQQRNKIYAKLERAKKNGLSFDQMRRLLGLDSGFTFNLESAKRAALKGDETGAILSTPSRFGKAWWDFDDKTQGEIVEAILAAESEEELEHLARENWGLDMDRARAVARVRLPIGYAFIGRKAMTEIVPIMRDQGLGYYDAAKEAGYEASDFRADGDAEKLPDYPLALSRHLIGASGKEDDPPEKRFGRFPNPTVHIGLNQLRDVINAAIAAHGKPTEIVIELARDLKLNKKQKDKINARQAEETKRNDAAKQEIQSLGLMINGENIKRFKLWEELGPIHDRRCVYSNRPISKDMLYGDVVAIDHILPFQETLDDSRGNLLLCLRTANDYKRKRTPFNAFGQSSDGYTWPDILLRAENLPPNKRWRFAEDAMARFWKDSDFLARHLTDTAYLARVAREYLGQVCDPDKVWAVPGTLTALLRGKWGLNGILSDSNLKNRADHRHHAIDAAIVAVTDRRMLNELSRAAGESMADRIVEKMPDPWPGFRDELRERVMAVTVSLKPDHGKEGRLHEETAYGLVRDPAAEDGATVVYRKAFADLNEKEIGRIRDRMLRAKVQAHVETAKSAHKAVKDALAEFATAHGIRHVRLLKVEESLVRIKDKAGRVYKALSPGENWCIDIFEQPDGKWIGAPITVFEANQPKSLDEKRKGHPAARKVMRVHKGDYVKLEHDGAERIMRVVRLEAKAQRFRMAEHKEAGDLDARHNASNEEDPFRWVFVSFNQLMKRRARKVSIDALGRVREPGPPKA